MPALYTDKLRKKKSMFISNITSGIGSTDTVIACESLLGLPTDTAVTLTIDRVDENGERLYSQVERVTGIVSGDNLIDCLRGQDGTTARAHNAGAVLEDIWDASTWNNTIDWALVQHNQDGTHKGNVLNFIPLGAYDNATTYLINSVVTYQGSSYVSKSTTLGNFPTDTTYWWMISEAGTDGSTWSQGTSVPDDGLGNDSDFYLKTDTSDVYYKSSGTWSIVANIEGPQGVQGLQGNPGVSVIDVDSLINTTYLSDTTNTNAYAASFAVSPGSYKTGMKVNLKVTNGCTGASTLNINSLGAKSIKSGVINDTKTGDIKANQIIPLIYDGTNFQIVGGGGTGGADVLAVQVFS